jgi:hypothetical protein
MSSQRCQPQHTQHTVTDRIDTTERPTGMFTADSTRVGGKGSGRSGLVVSERALLFSFTRLRSNTQTQGIPDGICF